MLNGTTPVARIRGRSPRRRRGDRHQNRPRLERFEDRTLLSVAFEPAERFAVGLDPWGLAWGDFNNDGAADLVTADRTDNTVSVLLGAGDGSFEDATTIPVGINPVAVGVGDFDGDGNLDLAVVNELNSTVSVLLGAGDGTFGAPVEFAVGSGPLAIVVADFNGNGNLDLATANFGSNDVSILLGAGDGTFADSVEYAVGVGPAGLVAADLDGDGNLDLAVANSVSNTVSALDGNGDGTFGPATTIIQGLLEQPWGLAAGDLNGDGQADLVVTVATANSLYVLFGDGNSTTLDVGTSPFAVALADMNGNGLLDIIASNRDSEDVAVLLNNGDATFQDARFYETEGFGAYPLVVTDLTGDGRPDIAVANRFSSDVSVLTNIPLVVTIDDVTEYEGDDGTTNFVFTVSLNFDPGVPVTVNYATADGSAIAGVDYEAVSGTLTFDGTTERTITVPVLGNEDEQPDRQFFVNLSDPEVEDGTLIALEREQAIGTIWDDDSTIQFTMDTQTVREGENAIITVFRTGIGALNRTAMATLVVGGAPGDTATPGEDFLAFTQTLQFAPQETTKMFSVPVFEDPFIEPAETFSAELSDFVRVTPGDPTTTVVTIAASTAMFLPVDPSPRWTPVPYIDVEFSEAIDPDTFTAETLTLLRNGQPVELPEGVTIEPLDENDNDNNNNGDGENRRFRIGGLEGVTGTRGRYTLELDFGQIADPFGNLGEGVVSTEFSVRPDRIASDFDGDGISDVAIYTYLSDVQVGRFEVQLSSTGELLVVDFEDALPGDFPVIGDFDGDGRSDFGLYGFNAETGASRFLIRHSTTEETVALPFGGQGDFPVAGDFDGDGITDLAVYGFSPDNGFSRFAILHSGGSPILPTEDGATPGGAFPLAFGGFDDFPIAADFDGDGITDLAVYGFSPDNGFSRFGILHSRGNPIRPTATGATPQGAFPLEFGGMGDAPVVADYNGDGFHDLVVFGFSPDDDASRYAILLSDGGPILPAPGGATPSGAFPVQFGAEGDIPVGVGPDYDGNGQTDLAVFSGGQFLIRPGLAGEDRTVAFGRPGDIPLPPFAGLYDPTGATNGDANNGESEAVAARRKGPSLWPSLVDRFLEDWDLEA